ncbi:MAG: SRPBCC domain-containing protein [Acidobacteria bacterium]|nr:SRPBCC domain-containing protein [Acidobacteriota bacterium]
MIRTTAALAMMAALGASMQAQDTRPVVAEAVVDAPVEAVWHAWTTTEGLRSWLTPRVEIELRVGGRMRANYREVGVLGDAQTIENTILAFDPPRMLSIKATGIPEGFPFPNAIQHMWTVMYFEPVANATRTHVRVVSLGFGPDDESQKMRAFFEAGNAITLDQLRLHFAAVRQGR